MLLELTAVRSDGNDYPISINPDAIAWIADLEDDGCLINFSGASGGQVKVKEFYADVCKTIAGLA
jgi:hypothetical protein